MSNPLFTVRKYHTLNLSLLTQSQRDVRITTTSRKNRVKFMDTFNKTVDKIRQKNDESKEQVRVRRIKSFRHRRTGEASEENNSEQNNTTNYANSIGVDYKVIKNLEGIINKKNVEKYYKTREQFLEKYGYVKERDSKALKDKWDRIYETITYEQPWEKYQLTQLQNMRLDRQIRENMILLGNKTSGMNRKTKKQLTSIYESFLKQIQREEEELKDKETASETVFRSKKITALISSKNKINRLADINIEKLTNTVLQSNNKIYGKKYHPESTAWCAHILDAEPAQPQVSSNQNLSNTQ